MKEVHRKNTYRYSRLKVKNDNEEIDEDNLKINDDTNILNQNQLKMGGVIMTGIILCNRCRKKMDKVCKCGNPKCLVQIYWKGRYYEFRRDDQGYVFTYDKARDKLIEINNAIKKGSFKPEDFTDAKIKERKFENMMEKWLDQKSIEEKANELSPETLRCYRSYNRNYFQYFYNWDVREVGFEQLEDFKDQLPDHLSLKMKRNILNALHSFFVWLRRKGILTSIPVWPEIKGTDSQTKVAMDIEDQVEVLQEIPKEHIDIIRFLTETGLRIGEACALKGKDFDLKNGSVLIQRTWSGSKLVETTKGKNKKWIPLSDTAYEIACRCLQDRWPEDFMFINPSTKKGYRQEFLRRLWRKYSGVSITLYEATRHSFCTQVVEGGASVLEAKQLMRHADIRSTERYFHGSMKKMREIVNNRGKLISLVGLRNEMEVKNRSGVEVN